MGFYIDLRPVGVGEFKEMEIPFAFYALFAIAGFALLCMGLASHMLLADLMKVGSTFDFVLVGSIALSIPVYLLVGFKLFFVKKFLVVGSDTVNLGFTFRGRTIYQRKILINEIAKIDLINRKPTTNVAPVMHNNQQYHIQGHWRIVITLNSGKNLVLDKHTDVDALNPLYTLLKSKIKA